MQLQSNTLLQGGKYKIESVLGQGGFGITYLAAQKITVKDSIGEIETTIKVAIKEFFMKDVCNRDTNTSWISIPSEGSKEMVERFKQKFIKEAQNISLLKHPFIVKVLNIFEENGTAYYVMEYVEGGSLHDYISQNGALQEIEALHYIQEIADALNYIHQHQINHLDVKPGNVLRRANAHVVLIDFGLSKRYDESGQQTSTTPVGISTGYAPMEQYKKSGVGTFSPATDIYSLGATLYKLLTGETPPDASDIVDEGVPELPFEISEPVKLAIEKAMEPRRANRPQSIPEFLGLLGLKNEDKESIASFPYKQSPTKQNKCLDSDEKKDEETIFVFAQKEIIQNDEKEILGIAIDLGLSVKWSSHNIGASLPEEYGGLYGWADPSGKKTSTILADYPNSNPISNICSTQYDIASAKWKGKWRLPTPKEFLELSDKCIWKWITYKEVLGYQITGPNGKQIFLPASGYRNGNTDVNNQGNFGFYWSGILKSNGNAHCLYFDNSHFYPAYNSCCYIGRSVRPVTE